MLQGISASQPPGYYSVETRTEYKWRFPLSWNKATAMTIRLHLRDGLDGGVYDFELDQRDLVAAMEGDRRLTNEP